MRSRGRPWFIALIVGAAMVAGGCTGGGSDSAPPPTAPPSTSDTAAPTTSSPPATTGSVDSDIPAAARANTPEGAEAFVRYFVEQVNRSWQTANSELVRPLASDECTSCTAFMGTADEYKRLGHHYDGVPMAVADSIVSAFSETEGTVVFVYGEQAAAAIVDSSGATVRSIPAAKSNIAVTARFGDSWKVTKVQGLGTQS